MKTLSLVLVLALSTSSCSMFSKNKRMDRAYYKQLKQARAAREKRRQQLIQRERAQMPSLRNTPPPLEQQNVQRTPENQ
jgi:hypothetical protein